MEQLNEKGVQTGAQNRAEQTAPCILYLWSYGACVVFGSHMCHTTNLKSPLI